MKKILSTLTLSLAFVLISLAQGEANASTVVDTSGWETTPVFEEAELLLPPGYQADMPIYAETPSTLYGAQPFSPKEGYALPHIKVTFTSSRGSTQGNLLERTNAFKSEEIARQVFFNFKETKDKALQQGHEYEWNYSVLQTPAQDYVLFIQQQTFMTGSDQMLKDDIYYVWSQPTGIYYLHFSFDQPDDPNKGLVHTIASSFVLSPIPYLNSEEEWSQVKTISTVSLELPEEYQGQKINKASDANYQGESQSFVSLTTPVSYPYMVTINRVTPKESLGENINKFLLTDALKSTNVAVVLNQYFQESFNANLSILNNQWNDSSVEEIDQKYTLIMSGSFQSSAEPFPIYHEHYVITDPTGIYQLTFLFINEKDSRSDEFINKTLSRFKLHEVSQD